MGRTRRGLHRPVWLRSDVHASSRNPMLFVLLLAAIVLASIYVEGVREGWWN